ncbi:MAG: DUF4350 domain-containing protein [Pseudomonadota bacterium]
MLFDEGFGLNPAQGAAAVYLRQRYTLKPIDLPSQLPPGAVLLAAQPRALPAEELVALDKWVRDSGKLVLLADPMLEWPSERALGARLRPPVRFADTGLLAHWGLRLDAPDLQGQRTVKLQADLSDPKSKPLDVGVVVLSPGSLVKQGGSCQVTLDQVYAECVLGKGVALVVADADWLGDRAIEAATGKINQNLYALGTIIRAADNFR